MNYVISQSHEGEGERERERAICIDPHVCTHQSYHEFPPKREGQRERGRKEKEERE